MVKVEVVNKNKVPYQLEPMELPEIDFGFSSDASYASAEWAKNEVLKVKRQTQHQHSPKKTETLITAKTETPIRADDAMRADRIR